MAEDDAARPRRTADAGGRPPPLAFLLQDLAGGGAERVMVQLANGLSARGHPVDLAVVRFEGPCAALAAPELRVVPLPTRRTATAVPAVALYLRHRRPAAVVSALVHVNVGLVLARALSGLRGARRVRAVLTEHNQITINARRATRPLIKAAHRAVPYVYPLADAVVAVSQGVKDDLVAYSGIAPERVRVIHNPIVTPELLRRAREEPQHPWLRDKARPVVLAAGRLHPQKDFATLIRAFARLRREHGVGARLVVLGEGPERGELSALAGSLGVRDDVDLPGFCANPYALMARADVFALSSAWEGLPTVLVEAMACGTPVVATDCRSGPAEILRGGRDGPLVPVGDAAALADALRAVLNGAAGVPDREALRRRADAFTLERAVDAYAAVLTGGERNG